MAHPWLITMMDVALWLHWTLTSPVLEMLLWGLCVVALACVVLCYARRWYWYGLPNKVARRLVKGLTASNNDIPSWTDDLGENPCPRRFRRKHKMATAVAMYVKSRRGTPMRSAANDLVISRMAGDYMRRSNVRPSHIAALIPLVTQLVYLPTKYDVEAKELASTVEFAQRRKEFHLAGSRPGWFDFEPSLDRFMSVPEAPNAI